VFLQAVIPVISIACSGVVRLACAALFLHMAVQTASAADTTNASARETRLPAAAEGRVEGGRGSGVPVGNATFTVSSSSRNGARATTVAAADQSEAVVGLSPDWNGLWRDTGTFFGTQIVAAGIIYSMPQSVSGWSSEEKKNTFQKYSKNVFDPVFDKDQFYINYVLHPYWGATYYIRGRERGLDRFSAFAYSALISAMYEFGVECFFEKPSIQDLIVTPVAGSLLGFLVFEPWRESIRSKQELRWYDHAALVVTDPLGVLSLGIEKVFGIKSTIMVNYSNPEMQRRSTGTAVATKGSRIGVDVQFSLD